MNDLEQWARTIISVAGALTLLGYGARKVYNRVLAPVLDNLSAAADIIHRQLNPNGGSSLLDHVNQIPSIRSDISTLTHRIEKMEHSLANPLEIPHDNE